MEIRHHFRTKEFLNQNWRDPNTQFDSELGWSPISNRSINFPNWGTISSNSLGFRSPEIDQSKKQIVILGDSVTWGFGVNDTETFPYYLDKLVSDSGYQASNLAVSGYGIDQYYLFLKRHINKFNNLKTVVLVIFTRNDLANTASNCCYGKRKPLFIVKNNDLILTNNNIHKYCLRNLISNSFFLGKFVPYKGKVGNFLSFISGDKILTEQSAQEVSAFLLQKTYDLVSSHNAKLLVVLSPEKSDLKEKSRFLKWFESLLNNTKLENLSYLDYIEILKHNQKELDSIYLDEGHYTKTGNMLLAKAVYEYLKKDNQLH